MEKRLYRSRENTVIGGVCGGIAEYLDVDPTLVRLIWVISALYGGIGVIAYIVCLIVIPENRSGASVAARQQPGVPEGQSSTKEQPLCPEEQCSAEKQPDEGLRHDTEEQNESLQYSTGEQSGQRNQYDPGPSHGSERNRLLAGTLLICIGGLLLFRRWFYLIDLGRYWPVLLIAAGLVIIINGTKNRGESR